MTVGAITVTAQATSSGLTRRQGNGDFYLATSGDLQMATSGDFLMATDTDVANGSMTVDVAPGRVIPVGPVRAVDHAVTAKMMQPMLGVLERSRDGERRQAALDYAARNQLDLV